MVSCLLAPGSGIHASPACVFSGAATPSVKHNLCLGEQDKASRHGKLEVSYIIILDDDDNHAYVCNITPSISTN